MFQGTVSLIFGLFEERRHGDACLERRIDRSLDASWKEGVAAQIMLSILDYFLVPFALFLGASTQEIGVLVSLPFLLAAVSQFYAVPAVHWAGGRRRLLLIGTFVQALFMLPIAFLAFLGAFHGKILLLVLFISIFRVLSHLIGPAWGSLISDYLPENRRGKYLGGRSRAAGVAGVLGMVLWGSVLAGLNQVSKEAAFFALFMAAAVFRCVSFYYMSLMTDLPSRHHEGEDFTVWTFLKRFRSSNFVRFVLYVASITFATQLSEASFSVHMLRDLHFGYFTYMWMHLSAMITSLIVFPIWGRHADEIGNAKVLKLTSFFIPVIPLLWMVAKDPISLMLAQVLGGFVWCGFNLCAANYIYDAVPPQDRVRCLGYFNLINGMAIFFGASLGGYLAEHLPPLGGYSIVTLFFVSAVLRFAADFCLSPHFGEVRTLRTKVASSRLFLSVLGIRPLAGENVEAEIFPPDRFRRRRTN